MHRLPLLFVSAHTPQAETSTIPTHRPRLLCPLSLQSFWCTGIVLQGISASGRASNLVLSSFYSACQWKNEGKGRPLLRGGFDVDVPSMSLDDRGDEREP